MYQAIVFGITALFVASVLLLCRKNAPRLNLVLRILAVALYTVGFMRCFMPDTFVVAINGGWYEGIRYEKIDVLQSILRWGFSANYAVLILATFRPGRFFKNVASYVCLPFSVLTTLYFERHLVHFIEQNPIADSKVTITYFLELPEVARYIYFILELVLALAIPVLLQIGEKHYLRIRNKKEVGEFLIGSLGVILASMPVYIPQSFFGFNSLIPPVFGTLHLVWLALILVSCIGLYYAFRFKSREERFALCLFLALTLFFTRNSIYLVGLNIKRLPFQLCNIAAYFYLIALVCNWKKMFHFAFISNIVGALIAILMADFSVGTFSFWTMHYIVEHTFVVLVPAMVMGLRIFPRLDVKSLKYNFIGFTVYFICIFACGVLLNGITAQTHETVNYFYMFDMQVAVDFFPFLKEIAKMTVTFGRFSFNPIIVGLIYVAFQALCFLFFLLIRFCYKMEDDHLELRLSSIDLYEKITHKTSRRPKEFVE